MTLAGSNISPGSSIVFRIPARLKDTRLLGFSVHSLFTNLGFSEVTTYQLELALIESANNIVSHGDLKKDTAHITMKFAVADDKVICTFIDRGKPVQFLLDNQESDTCIKVGKLPATKRGFRIICDVMDTVTYKRVDGKNILTLVKYSEVS